ncbi:MAG: glycosyltransferase, partial [Treponemataceae bacterium]|nr:glycosyltransferase [Treponemataceae bacterium]
MKNIVFTGGGTGGHIYPGLAIVDEFKKKLLEVKIDGKNPEVSVVWIGAKKGSDRDIVEKSCSCDKFYGISSGKLRRYFSFQNLLDFFKIGIGFISSFFLLLKLKPLFVFSKGGFV